MHGPHRTRTKTFFDLILDVVRQLLSKLDDLVFWVVTARKRAQALRGFQQEAEILPHVRQSGSDGALHHLTHFHRFEPAVCNDEKLEG